MMLVYKIVQWASGTLAGRVVSAALVALGVVLAAVAYGDRRGSARIKQRNEEQRRDAVDKLRELEGDVEELSRDDLVFRSRRWMQ